MPTHTTHREKEAFYFVTFTCYKWLPLIEACWLYDYFKGRVRQLYKRGITVCGYVFMPNHIHLLVYVDKSSIGLNEVIGGAKRFMAYEIVNRLKILNKTELLKTLADGVQEAEKEKGKKHQVFRLSFDAKMVVGNEEIIKVLDDMHHNPVSKKWMLADDFVDFPYSSAKYYETGIQRDVEVWDYRNIESE